MAARQHSFLGRIERLDDGLRHHVLPVPEAVAEALVAAGHKRVWLALEGRVYRRALQRRKELGWLIIIGQPILSEARVKLGSVVEVALETDVEPDAIETPEERDAVLAQDETARERWESFTSGMQRSFMVHICSAKRSETRLKRSLDLAEKMRAGTLHIDKSR